MSLLDALLLDPYRMNIWIAARTDNIAGTGTHNDPYNGSTATLFDGIMNSIPAPSPSSMPGTCVHLGPGTFQTNGYSQTGGGWHPQPKMKIVGSGIDVTILQTVGNPTTEHYYAIGHDPSTQMDFLDISELTIDCNLSAFGAGCASGGMKNGLCLYELGDG